MIAFENEWLHKKIVCKTNDSYLKRIIRFNYAKKYLFFHIHWHSVLYTILFWFKHILFTTVYEWDWTTGYDYTSSTGYDYTSSTGYDYTSALLFTFTRHTFTKKVYTLISMIYTAYRYINFKRNDKCMTTVLCKPIQNSFSKRYFRNFRNININQLMDFSRYKRRIEKYT